jgi:thiol-disulfide isomerase/thioredoxin
MRRTLPYTVLTLVLLALCHSALAQSYEVLPWPARKATPTVMGTDTGGRLWRLADLRGKVVVINFWASWCAPCLQEMPSLQALTQHHAADKLVVLTVNLKESTSDVQQFAQRTGLTLPIVLDPQGATARAWGVSVFPTTVLVRPDGRVAESVRGALDWTSEPAADLLAPLLALARPGLPSQR